MSKPEDKSHTIATASSDFTAIQESAVPVENGAKVPPPATESDDKDQRCEQITMMSLAGELPQVLDDDWKSVVGMFDNDPIIKEISAQARAIRKKQRA